jgi:hypothetical protein
MAVSRVSTSSILQGFPKSRSLLSGNPAFIPSDFESIATVTVGVGGQSTISFSSIPSTYQHLQLRFAGSSSAVNNFRMRFNSDTGSNYAVRQILGTGAALSASSSASQTSMNLVYDNKANSLFPAIAIVDVLDYSNSNKNKVVSSLAGSEQNNNDGLVMFRSNLWMNTAAVTSISIFLDSGSFNQYSSFALYGIKG